MRLGIVADIHGAVANLELALDQFRRRGVDQVVTLGDACDTYSAAGRADDVATLLREAGAVGVWGNHDVGLCFEVAERTRREADPATLSFMAGLQPYWIVDGCRFSHVEPWLDAHKVEDLWYLDGPPDTVEKANRSFAAVPERVLFVGHFHRWMVMSSAGRLDWEGDKPLDLEQASRYLVVVAPVVGGWCAVFDTVALRLHPISCGANS